MTEKPRLIPTGNCWCGCGREVGLGKFFAAGHDKIAEAALVALRYEGSVPHFLHAHGYGPHHSVTADAVADTNTGWVECNQCTTKPGYRGTTESVRNHQRKHHQEKS
jgi:hypothetical protein